MKKLYINIQEITENVKTLIILSNNEH